MDRIYQVNEHCDVSILITNIDEEEQSRLDRLVEEFIESHADAQTMGEELRSGIQQGRITSQVIERLSKWCETGGPYIGGEIPAKRLASSVLGAELPRLVDQENVRVPEYRERILSILQQHISTRGE